MTDLQPAGWGVWAGMYPSGQYIIETMVVKTFSFGRGWGGGGGDGVEMLSEVDIKTEK